MKLNLTQLDQTAKLMHMFDDFFEDWCIDCDDVTFTIGTHTLTVKIASLSLDQSAKGYKLNHSFEPLDQS